MFHIWNPPGIIILSDFDIWWIFEKMILLYLHNHRDGIHCLVCGWRWVALKNLKKFGPQEKVEMTLLREWKCEFGGGCWGFTTVPVTKTIRLSEWVTPGDTAIPGMTSLKDLQHSSRVVHGSDGPAGRVGSGRVGSRFCRILAGRVGSGQHFGFFSYFLIISWYLNPYESSNTTFRLIDFLRYLIYNN